MGLLLQSANLSAALTTVQQFSEIAESIVILAVTVALVAAFFALLKDA